MTTLDVAGLSVHYSGIEALRDLALSVRDGELVALIGSNGAGKTTLLRTISGLMRPTSGSIAFDGQRIDALPGHQIARLGLVQVPEGRRCFPYMTVRENLLVAFRRSRAELPAELERVEGLFPVLASHRDQLAQSLSGGEQQMLAIARALMARPRLLLLDEPSVGLAPLMVRRIFDLITTIHQSGMTILMVEQNAKLALETADRGYVIENGAIVLEGPARDLASNPRVQEAYLGQRATN